MGCSNLCSCQFNWPIDTQGSKRDPINSEKAWLDFAVRFLSREAVGKGRGQETVWSAGCKPSWWNSEVGLPWKNPTSNPKDTKEVLHQKYDALEKHLKKEGRFPEELVEEARLWSEGKNKELFLFTSLTSLLGKVAGVHSSVTDAIAKTEELKAEIDQLLFEDIKTCLKSTLHALENLSYKNTSKNNLKRHYSMTENSEPVVKIQKLHVPEKLTTQNSSRLSVPSGNKEKVVTISKNPATVATISAFSERLLAKQRKLKENISITPKNKNVPDKSKIMSSPVTINTSVPSTVCSEMLDSSSQPLSVAVQSSPLYINISHEELNQLLKGTPVPLKRPEHSMNGSLSDSSKEITINTNISENCQIIDPDDISLESQINPSHQEIPISNLTNPLGELSQVESDDLDLNLDFLAGIDFEANSPLITPNLCNELLSDSYQSDYNLPNLKSPIDDLLNETVDVSSQLNLASANTDNSKIAELGVLSNENTSSQCSVCHTHGSGQNTSDHGYSSDEGTLDLNSLYSPQEQSQLWGDDGSFILDRFMTGLDLL